MMMNDVSDDKMMTVDRCRLQCVGQLVRHGRRRRGVLPWLRDAWESHVLVDSRLHLWCHLHTRYRLCQTTTSVYQQRPPRSAHFTIHCISQSVSQSVGK